MYANGKSSIHAYSLYPDRCADDQLRHSDSKRKQSSTAAAPRPNVCDVAISGDRIAEIGPGLDLPRVRNHRRRRPRARARLHRRAHPRRHRRNPHSRDAAEAFAGRHHRHRRQLRHQRVAGNAARRTARPDEPARRTRRIFAIQPFAAYLEALRRSPARQ